MALIANGLLIHGAERKTTLTNTISCAIGLVLQPEVDTVRAIFSSEILCDALYCAQSAESECVYMLTCANVFGRRKDSFTASGEK